MRAEMRTPAIAGAPQHASDERTNACKRVCTFKTRTSSLRDQSSGATSAGCVIKNKTHANFFPFCGRFF
jgi:hypothetical protein